MALPRLWPSDLSALVVYTIIVDLHWTDCLQVRGCCFNPSIAATCPRNPDGEDALEVTAQGLITTGNFRLLQVC